MKGNWFFQLEIAWPFDLKNCSIYEKHVSMRNHFDNLQMFLNIIKCFWYNWGLDSKKISYVWAIDLICWVLSILRGTKICENSLEIGQRNYIEGSVIFFVELKDEENWLQNIFTYLQLTRRVKQNLPKSK